MSLSKRLARVEEHLLPRPGCETCCGWTGVVLQGDEGPHRSERCPDCGLLVLTTVVVRIVGVPVAAL